MLYLNGELMDTLAILEIRLEPANSRHARMRTVLS